MGRGMPMVGDEVFIGQALPVLLKVKERDIYLNYQ